MKQLLYLCAILALLSFSSCELLGPQGTSGSGSGQSSDDLNVASTGIVQQVQLNGGPIFWGILTGDGKKYEILNLAEGFRQHGLRVKFEGLIAFVGTPTAGYGSTVLLSKIEKI
jgi:hypothetical protein